MLVDENRFDPLTGRNYTVRTVVRGGRGRAFEFFTSMFGFTELRDWLMQTGFSAVAGRAGDASALTRDAPRMIVAATE